MLGWGAWGAVEAVFHPLQSKHGSIDIVTTDLAHTCFAKHVFGLLYADFTVLGYWVLEWVSQVTNTQPTCACYGKYLLGLVYLLFTVFGHWARVCVWGGGVLMQISTL